jgi:exopolysaccharide biosynthesis protein
MRRLNVFITSIVIVATLFSCQITREKYTAKTEIDNCNDSTIVFQDKYIVVKKYWDKESETSYFLTRIKHKDENGELLQLKLEAAVVDSGETIHQFATRLGKPIIATNASTVLSNKAPWPKVSTGILIVNGKILSERNTRFYTLGIKNNNGLVAYPPGTTAREIIKDGARNAITAFTPIIRDYQTVPDSIIGLEPHQLEKHPRQVIVQLRNKDLMYLSCGGRGFDGAGMTISDVERILRELKEDVKFAYNLDGGGSTTTVIYGNQITKKIDKNGTENRTRANCLYIEANNR